MERFYGNQHAVEVTSDDTEQLLRAWREAAAEAPESVAAVALVEWFDRRIRRPFGCRAFRISPPPEPISAPQTLRLFAEMIAAQVDHLAAGKPFLGKNRHDDERLRWLANLLDLLGFVNEARGAEFEALAPVIDGSDGHDVLVRRMWNRFVELSRRENYLFPDDPACPSPEALLDYLDQILSLIAGDGRERRRQWPFPKILWEREILLEKLGRYDELAATMRRSAALEGEAFQRATEEYLGALSAS